MSRWRDFAASMSGRIFLILLIGVAVAATAALALANAKRRQDFDRLNIERSVDRVQEFVGFYAEASAEVRAKQLSRGWHGVRVIADPIEGGTVDGEFESALRARGAPLEQASASRVAVEVCYRPRNRDGKGRDDKRLDDKRPTAAELKSFQKNFEIPTCRLVRVQLADGTALQLSIDTPLMAKQYSALTDPLYLILLSIAAAGLAYWVARMAAAPLDRLAQAAGALGSDLDRAPMPEHGPTEVRHAAQSFNLMQRRLQKNLGERTQMLAAITHDLQTPMTRLRLRMEKVDDEILREKLVSDLAAMQAMVREGLDLARSAETAEQRVSLDLDSLLQSLVEDAAEAGADAHFISGCGADVRVRPMAVRRLFANLIDNAIQHGGSVEVCSEHVGTALRVRIRDRGPGIPDAELERVFDPFVRIETSRSRDTGGAGLGLTIARTLAEKNGASLVLHNVADGGLEAWVQWPRRD